jgi:aminoglycoside 6'-N-acetyltransferase
MAERDGRPIGFVQLLDAAAEPTRYWGDVSAGVWAIDIWIGAEGDRGRGDGMRMLRAAVQRCVEHHGATEVLVDPLAANVRAHRFYRRAGFVPVGPRRFGGDDCLVHRSTSGS